MTPPRRASAAPLPAWAWPGLLLASAAAAGSLGGPDDDVRVPSAEIAPGVDMPVLSIGTGGLESQAASDIVSAWLGQGGRGVDAAWIYRNQESVRAAIAKSGVPRENLFITSKIPGCTMVNEFLEADLKQLGLQYIDLMLIHFPGPVPSACPGAWARLEEYHARGVFKAIGVSNFKAQDLEALMKNAKVVPAVNQIRHNVLEHDDQTLAFCKANNITVEAYSPLGRSGRSGDIPGNKVVQAIATSHKVSTYQVALKWVLQHGHVLTFQSSSAAHQAADADLFGFTLTPDEMSSLDGLQNFSSAPPSSEPLVV